MEYRFKADEWRNLTAAQRVRRCILMAEEARDLAKGAGLTLQAPYLGIAEDWLKLAEDIRGAKGSGAYPNSNWVRQVQRSRTDAEAATAIACDGMEKNLLLLSLPRDEYNCVAACSTNVELKPQSVLFEAGNLIDDVFFLRSGVVSLLTAGRNGRGIETGRVGRDGIVGSNLILGSSNTRQKAVVQIGASALKIPGPQLLKCYRELPTLSMLLNRQVALLLFQAGQNALCLSSHSVQARFSRWLLEMSDRLNSEVIELTQDACSQNLGVQRTSVSMVAHTLHRQGSIMTRRGKIVIQNRSLLLQEACDCYLEVKHAFDEACSGLLHSSGWPAFTEGEMCVHGNFRP